MTTTSELPTENQTPDTGQAPHIWSLSTHAASGQAAPARAEGEFPLTPVEHLFTRRDLDHDHYNQSLLFICGQAIEAEPLRGAIRALVEHHDALRLRLVAEGSQWRQFVATREDTELLQVADLAGLGEPEQEQRYEQIANQANASLDLSAGPLLRAVLFHYGAGRPDELLLVVHHLAVDTASWGFLLEDLTSAYSQLAAGGQVSLPPTTSSFRDWAERLDEYANSGPLPDEAEFFLKQSVDGPLPVDSAGDNLEFSTRTVSVRLPAEHTETLLSGLPVRHGMRMGEVLLALVAQAVTEWTGRDQVTVHLEGHGREPLFDDVDLARTVGWFTNVYPVTLRSSGGDQDARLSSVKDQLALVPRRGMGYGIARYLRRGDPAVAVLDDAAEPQIVFNYHGLLEAQTRTRTGPGGLFTRAPRRAGASSSPDGRRSGVIVIEAAVVDGGLAVNWQYSAALHREATISSLAQRVLGLLRQLSGPAAHDVGYRPAPAAIAPDAGDIAVLCDQLGVAADAVEDVYGLSPAQSGILFHALADSADYVLHYAIDLTGELDEDALAAAWAQVVARHPALRSRFVWEGLESPAQVVLRGPRPGLERIDLRATADAPDRLARMQAAQRQRGLDLRVDGGFRMVLVRTADDQWRFIWMLHHILTDAWSEQVVWAEVLAAYESLRSGAAVSPPEPVPYRRFVDWVSEQQQDDGEFWRGELAGICAATALPGERPATGPGLVEELEHVVADGLAAGLRAVCRRRGVTLSVVLQGVWGLLLSLYSGDADVVFGVSMAGRTADVPGIERIVGLVTNTVPVRVHVDPDQPVARWLEELFDRHLRLLDHQNGSLAAIQRASAVPGGQPLFTSIFAFENFGKSGLRVPAGLTAGTVDSWLKSNYGLDVDVHLGDQMSVTVKYPTDRFDRAVLADVLARYETVLARLAADGGGTVGQLTALAGGEREQVVHGWNATSAPFPAERCVHELFEEQARTDPAAVAVVAADGALVSFGELDERADQLAGFLRGAGVGVESAVGVCIDHSVEMLVAVLGVMKAGAAYVPLDPSHPADRLGYVLADSAASVLLTVGGQLSSVPSGFTGRVVCVDEAEVMSYPSPGPVRSGVRPDNLVYVIYTSGSTGRPKGVQVSHRSLVNFLWWAAQRWNEGRDGSPMVGSIAFDLSVPNFLLPLTAGKSVTLLPVDDRLPALARALTRPGADFSCLKVTPGHLEALRGLLAEGTRLDSVRVLVVAGEVFKPGLVKEWQVIAPDARIVNEYGPTETVVGCSVHDIGPGFDASGPVPIGRPIGNMRMYVLDRRGEPVPPGVAGEVYIGGAGVARGYGGRPGLTAERFVPDALSGNAGERLYRTGDLALLRTDGDLEFLGRADQQVKVRGYRIEPGEIEARLAEHPRVAEAVVVVRDTDGHRRLVGYVVPVAGAVAEAVEPVDMGELREFLAGTLPDYMVPSVIVRLDELPRALSGKTDRDALPDPDLARAPVVERPATATERILGKVWSSVLGKEEVGLHDDFYQLGGDSLLLILVVSRVREYDLRLSLPQAMRYVTIAELASCIDGSDEGGSGG